MAFPPDVPRSCPCRPLQMSRKETLESTIWTPRRYCYIPRYIQHSCTCGQYTRFLDLTCVYLRRDISGPLHMCVLVQPSIFSSPSHHCTKVFPYLDHYAQVYLTVHSIFPSNFVSRSWLGPARPRSQPPAASKVLSVSSACLRVNDRFDCDISFARSNMTLHV